VERCEALVGYRPSAFAYPYGDFDEESERLVEKAGFTCACATVASAVSARSRPFALPRIQIGNWNSKSLSRALAAAR
jgi:peptidoglycan/xylan/chitin deacetylase (PgdA/CDA1 family)